MLLPETEIAHTIGALKQRLEQLDLTIVSFDSIEASGRHEVPSTSRLRRTA